MKNKILIGTISFYGIVLFLAPQNVFAIDSCPSSDGHISQDTLWTKNQMVDNKYDCKDTDLVIDGVVLTLETSSISEVAEELLEVKSLRFKNGGDLRVSMPDSGIFTETAQRILQQVIKPKTATQITISVGLGMQIITLITLFGSQGMSMANVLGVIGQVLFGRSKCKDLWGVVYNSFTATPVPFAIVSLFDAETGKIITSTVTDLDGRYGFPVSPGTYYLEIKHDEFIFPSTADNKLLGNNLNLYQEGDFTVEQNTSIDFNIPVDPRKQKLGIGFIKMLWAKIKSWVLLGNYLFMGALFILNLVLTIYSFHLINLGLAILYFTLIVLRFLSQMKKPKAWGTVFNSKTDTPVTSAFVKVYQEGTNKLIDTKLTDKAGNFQLFLPKDKYTTIAAATGYNAQKAPLAISTEGEAVSVDIPINPTTSVQQTPFG